MFSLKTWVPQLPIAKIITKIKVRKADKSQAEVIDDSKPTSPIFEFSQAWL